MNASLGLYITRVLILAGLIIYFFAALSSTIMHTYTRNVLTPAVPIHDQHLLQDPGIRVLLTNRALHKKYHRRVDLLILQACILLCPDPGHEDLRIALDPRDNLSVQSALDGIKINCDKLNSTWNVSRIVIQPLLTSADSGARTVDRLQFRQFEASDHQAVFSLGTHRYRGNIEITHSASQRLTAINCLPIESYLEGVIPSEMPYVYPDEALCAQAIASRTFAYAQKIANHSKTTPRLYDVVDTVQDQEYLGTSKEHPHTTRAVHTTDGLILTHNKSPFLAYFNASSGGLTAAVSDCFPATRCSDGITTLDTVMVSKEDPYCLEGIDALHKRGSHWQHETHIQTSDLKKSIGAWMKKKKKNVRVGYVQDLIFGNALPGRIARVEVLTNQDGVDFTFSGMDFRNHIIGPRVLRSLYCVKKAFDKETATHIITTIGLGHGVGLSQVSAYAMAKKHHQTARQILHFFYEKTELKKEW